MSEKMTPKEARMRRLASLVRESLNAGNRTPIPEPAAPRREDATEPKTIDLMKALTDSLARREDAAGARERLEQLLYEHVRDRDEEAVELRIAFGIVPDMRDLKTQLLERAAALSTAERERDADFALLRDIAHLLDSRRQEGGKWEAWDESIRGRIASVLIARVPSGGEEGRS